MGGFIISQDAVLRLYLAVCMALPALSELDARSLAVMAAASEKEVTRQVESRIVRPQVPYLTWFHTLPSRNATVASDRAAASPYPWGQIETNSMAPPRCVIRSGKSGSARAEASPALVAAGATPAAEPDRALYLLGRRGASRPVCCAHVGALRPASPRPVAMEGNATCDLEGEANRPFHTVL